MNLVKLDRDMSVYPGIAAVTLTGFFHRTIWCCVSSMMLKESLFLGPSASCSSFFFQTFEDLSRIVIRQSSVAHFSKNQPKHQVCLIMENSIQDYHDYKNGIKILKSESFLEDLKSDVITVVNYSTRKLLKRILTPEESLKHSTMRIISTTKLQTYTCNDDIKSWNLFEGIAMLEYTPQKPFGTVMDITGSGQIVELEAKEDSSGIIEATIYG